MMKRFDLQLLPDILLEQVTLPDRRYYQTESGLQLSSVTTVLGRNPAKRKALAAWRKRVGNAEANAIGAAASRRGSIVHDAVEQYLLGNEDYLPKMPIHREIIPHFTRLLDKHVGTVYGVEKRLFSEKMALAGTADLITEWDGIRTIVDFKTSKRFKAAKDITDYFLQSTVYAMMMEEQYDIGSFEQIAILIYVDDQTVYPYIRQISPEYKAKAAKIFAALSKV